MIIGIIIGRIGGEDGVALETEKWLKVLKRLGHEVHLITGKLEGEIKNVTVVPELDFHHPLSIREQDDAFFKQKVKETVLINRVERLEAYIEKQLLIWIVKQKIDVLISENASALPCHLSMGLAIKNVVEKTGIALIAHGHDFGWERKNRYKTKYKFVKQIMRECFPLATSGVCHAVINSAAAETLKKRFSIDATLIPNVVDFDRPFGRKSDFNHNLPKSLKLKSSDIPLFQVTRIVDRKGIEVAIKLVNELDDPNIKLVITGGCTDDHNANYYGSLVDLVDQFDLVDQIIFADDFFAANRQKSGVRKRVYSISDAYAYARACTYFSTYEGFGNAFLEAILAKRPIFVNNYKPVFWSDIGIKGFQTVMLNNNKLTAKAVEQMKDIIYDRKLAKDISEFNFNLGRKYFSFEILEMKLQQILKRV